MTTYEEATALARRAIAKAAELVAICYLFGAFLSVMIKFGGGTHKSWLWVLFVPLGGLGIALAPLALVLGILALEDTEDLE